MGTSAASEEQLKNGGGPNVGFGGGGGGAVDVGDISDIFDAFFGGNVGGARGRGGGGARRNANAPVSGDDLQVEVEVPFMTGVFGGTEKVRVRRLEECGTCTGSGLKPGAKARTCSVCGGQGAVNNMQRTPFGVFSNVQTCPNCQGSGQEVEAYCPTCKGKGSNSEIKEVVIKIPAGVEAGTTLRVRDGESYWIYFAPDHLSCAIITCRWQCRQEGRTPRRPLRAARHQEGPQVQPRRGRHSE